MGTASGRDGHDGIIPWTDISEDPAKYINVDLPPYFTFQHPSKYTFPEATVVYSHFYSRQEDGRCPLRFYTAASSSHQATRVSGDGTDTTTEALGKLSLIH